MGYYCRICDSSRPNEAFSGKGRKTHVCKRCQRLPVAQRRRIEESDETWGFMYQSNISEKNLARLSTLSRSEDPDIARDAALVLEVGRVHPRKKRRIKFLARNHRHLLNRLAEIGFDGLIPHPERNGPWEHPLFDDDECDEFDYYMEHQCEAAFDYRQSRYGLEADIATKRSAAPNHDANLEDGAEHEYWPEFDEPGPRMIFDGYSLEWFLEYEPEDDSA